MIKYICNKANECTKDNCDHKNKHIDEPSCAYTELCSGEQVRCIPINDPSEKEIKDKLKYLIDAHLDNRKLGLYIIVDTIMKYLKDIGLIVKEEIE